MRIETFVPAHLERLLLQPGQEAARPLLSDPNYGNMLANGRAYTAFDGDRVLCCAGLIPMWEGRAEAWALMGDGLRHDFLSIHLAAKRFLDESDFRRIEAAVDAKFAAAITWLERLGFRREGYMLAYTPDGRDCIRYARIRGQ